jgi:iron(III) transport system permease protein
MGPVTTTRLGRSLADRALRVETAVLAGGVVLIGCLTLVPLCYVLWRTFVDGGTVTVRFVRVAYGAFGLGELLWNSLRFAAGSTLVAVGLGTALAYLIVRTDVPARRLLFAGALVPLLVPGVLYTIAWVFLAAPRSGALNQVLGTGTLDVFSIWGMIAVEGLHLAPLAFLFMAAAFRSLDPTLEESAFASGARRLTVFRRVTLPLVRPALSATVLIMAVRAIEAFEVPALLGLPARVWVFTSRIWQSLGEFPPSFGAAGAYALPLLVLTFLGVLLHRFVVRRARSYETITSRGRTPRPVALGRWRWPATAALASYVVVTAVLPILILLYVSTQRVYTGVSGEGFARMSLGAYGDLLGDDLFLRATGNSLLLGIGTATVVMCAMTVVSWVVVRSRTPGRGILDALAFLPIAIPGIVVGLAVLVVYLRVPIPVYGTLWILLIAYVTRFMPYGIRTASVSMGQIARELEDAAHASGAGWWQTFRRVLAPLLLPGFVAGWVYILLVSLRELSSSLILYSPGREVLPVLIWNQYQDGQFPQLAALGVLMVLATVGLAGVAYRLGVRVGVLRG